MALYFVLYCPTTVDARRTLLKRISNIETKFLDSSDSVLHKEFVLGGFGLHEDCDNKF